MSSRAKPVSFAAVALWALAGCALVLGLGLSPRLFGVGNADLDGAVAKLAGVSTVPFALSAMLFFSGRRLLGIAITSTVVLAFLGMSALVLLAS